MTEEQKPKRVLTEAQRLAFLKGREKRMANIEKKRLEKLEVAETETPPPATVPKPVTPEPPKPVTPEPPKPETPLPSPPKLRRYPVIDEEKIAARVADEVFKKMLESKPVKKPRQRKPKLQAVKEEPAVVHNFSWL